MSDALQQVLKHLEKLVAFDTQNPPRHIDEGGIFAYLQEQLPGFEFTIDNQGNGCISLLCVRGKPDLLFNVHMDTVPANELWKRDPHKLSVEGERTYGLGACDIKGAAACLLVAASQVKGDAAFLFSSDEEAGSSVCIRSFLKSGLDYDRVVVCEPTKAQAVLAHRGIGTATGHFTGVPGHASDARALVDSAVHRAISWSQKALSHIEGKQNHSYESLQGLRFNIGRIEGGIKPNMIAGDCSVRFGLRSLPGQSPMAIIDELTAMAEPGQLANVEPGFIGPSLPASDLEAGIDKGRQLAESLGLEIGQAVDFWTEASLFSEAGAAALVYGPGDIAQAHTADEWVELSQLQTVVDNFTRIIG